MIFQSLTFPGSNVTIQGPVDVSRFGGKLTLGSILGRLISVYIFPIAGLILLIMLIIGGFEMLTSAGDPEKVKAGQAKVVSAFVGFLIVFVAYWLMEIVETALGFRILG